jgi:hypothetical protein
VVAVAVLAVLALAGGPAVATAGTVAEAGTNGTAAAPTPEDVCSALSPEELTVAATTALGEEALTGAATFHGGTELTVVLCDGEGRAVATSGGQGWRLGETDAIANVTRTERSYVVTLARTNAEVALPGLVREKAPEAGPTVRVTAGAVHDSGLSGVGRLTFENGTAMQGYASTESAFLVAAGNVGENASALERAADEVNASGLQNGTDGTLEELRASRERLSRTGNDTMLALHRSAAADANTAGALDRVSETRRNASAAARGALGSYVAALDRNVRVHRGSIRGTVLSAMIPGVIVGVLLGAVLPYRRGNEVADFYQQRSGGTSEYDLTVLRWPLLAGAAVLVLGLVLLFVTGGHEGFIP